MGSLTFEPRRHARYFVVACILGFSAGCKDIYVGDPSAQFTTEHDTYVVEHVGSNQRINWYWTTVVARFTNVGGLPIRFDSCYEGASPMFNVLTEDQEKWPAYNHGWGCVGGVPDIIVHPGETRTDTLPFFGEAGFNTFGNPSRTAIDGFFRLWYRGRLGEDTTTTHFLSDPFRIVLPE